MEKGTAKKRGEQGGCQLGLELIVAFLALRKATGTYGVSESFVVFDWDVPGRFAIWPPFGNCCYSATPVGLPVR